MKLPVLAWLVLIAGCAHGPARWDSPPKRPAPAPPDPMVTVTPIAREAIAAQLGGHLVRGVEPGWVLACARAEPQLDLDVAITSAGRPLPMVGGAKSFAELTGERYPAGVSHSYLRTGDFPLAVHVLTMGVLTVLTLHVERTWTPPTEEQVRSAVPRALALEAVLARQCAHGRPLVIRRPAANPPLELVMVATNHAGSVRARIALPDGERLEDRLAAAGRIRPAALPGAQAATWAQKAVDRPCDESWRIGLSGSECAAIGYARADEVSSWGLTVPEPPPALGTPRSSAAARPWWDGDAGYAPDALVSRLDATIPVGETVDAGLVACTLGELRVPGEDTDHVFGEVKVGGKWWRVSAQHPVLPLLSLPPRATLQIALYDWDWLSGDDLLATLTLKRRGAELSAVQGGPERRRHVEMTCRIYDRPAVEAAFTGAWVRATDGLDAFAEGPVQIRPEELDLGFREAGLGRSRGRITEAAGLVGWDDPRVRLLLERQEAAEQRFWRGARESLEKLSRGDQPVVLRKPEPDALQVIDARLRCAPACRVALTVENPAKTRAFATDFYQARLVLDDGRAVEIATPFSEVPAGGRATLTLQPREALPPASRAAKPWRVVVNGFRRLEILPIAAE